MPDVPSATIKDPLYPSQTKTLSGQEALATAPEYQRDNLAQAIYSKHQPLNPEQNSMAYRGGEMLGNYLPAISRGVAPFFNNGAGLGALAAGGAGALLGYGAGKAMDFVTGGESRFSPGQLALILGALGAATGGYFGHTRSKSASWKEDLGGGESKMLSEIARYLSADRSLDSGERLQILALLQQQDASTLQAIKRVLMSSGGAAAGALIMKLLGGGMLPMLMGAAAGGAAGSYFSTPRNSAGLPYRAF